MRIRETREYPVRRTRISKDKTKTKKKTKIYEDTPCKKNKCVGFNTEELKQQVLGRSTAPWDEWAQLDKPLGFQVQVQVQRTRNVSRKNCVYARRITE